MAGGLAAMVLALAAPAAAPIAAQEITLARPAELRATITADCRGCAWDVEGREAVTLSISVDGTYSQHLPLVRRGAADYDVLLGAAAAGRHRVTVEIDPAATAAGLRGDGAATAKLTLAAIGPDAPESTALSLAPFVYARADTVGRFTDTPVFMWYETEPTPAGTRYRYSVIFTNEDGGTPADRLMATWGRTTDIEYLYSVEVDRRGKILAADYQGPEHKVTDFRGRREGGHALLWVSTSNNMVRDAGETRIRYAPAPKAADLANASREIVMDANPWLYALMAQELQREGKIVPESPPGNRTISDPRRFAYVEACADVGTAALAVSVGHRAVGHRFGGADGAGGAGTPEGVPYEWSSSDRGLPQYRVVRDGCFRAAIPLPAGVAAGDIRALRLQAFARPPSEGRPPVPPTTVRLTRVNMLFMLDERYVPGPSAARWTGAATLQPGGAPFELPLPR